MSLGGKQVRLTISNRFGTEALNIGGVTAAAKYCRGICGGQFPSALRAVTFDEKPSFVIAPRATVISDPVAIDVMPLSDVANSIFLPAGKVSYYTRHPVSHQTNYRAVGDDLRSGSMPNIEEVRPWRMLTAIDVMAPAADATRGEQRIGNFVQRGASSELISDAGSVTVWMRRFRRRKTAQRRTRNGTPENDNTPRPESRVLGFDLDCVGPNSRESR